MKHQPQSQYFKVTAEWMQKAGRGDESKAFEVIRIEENQGQPEYDVIVLNDGGLEWPVFRMRGHMVKPFTLFISEGRFEPCCVASEPPPLATVFDFHQFNTKAEARIAADDLNAALHLVVVADLKTAAIETIRKGSTVRRLYRTGLPMLKEYTVDAYDKASGCYALLDGKGGTFWLQMGKLVAVD